MLPSWRLPEVQRERRAKGGCVAVSAEHPVGKVTSKVVDDSLEVLTCQAFGFYPKEIQATWTRDGEIWEHKTFHRKWPPTQTGPIISGSALRSTPRRGTVFGVTWSTRACRSPWTWLGRTKQAISSSLSSLGREGLPSGGGTS
ncbi:HLA class I histocompatibility antigen, Cw-16 alpha chain, partial [Ophiophagus hannah]